MFNQKVQLGLFSIIFKKEITKKILLLEIIYVIFINADTDRIKGKGRFPDLPTGPILGHPADRKQFYTLERP